MKNLIWIIIIVLNIFYTQAQDSTYYVGHSLVNLNMPYQTWKLLDANGVSNYYKHHINIGTALQQNWQDSMFNSNPIWDFTNNVNVDRGTNHFEELQNSYSNIVITEAVPLLNYSRDTTVKYGSSFYNLAQTSNPGIQKYLYATWEGDAADGLSWRNHVASLVPEWEDIADKCSIETGGYEVFIVPGNLAMIALFDTLQLRNIGSFTSITDFFEPDGIHLNFNGNYLIACLMAAVVYESNSFGLEAVAAGPYTNDTVILDDVARLEIQQIAIDVACSYARTGLPGSFCNATSSTVYVYDTLYTTDTITIVDNMINQDSIYLQETSVSSNSFYQNDTIYQTDTIYTLYHLLLAGNQQTGLLEISGLTQATIYPNPFSSSFSIEMNSDFNEQVLIELFGLNGERLISSEYGIQLGFNTIPISVFNVLLDGIYFIRVSSENINILNKIYKVNN